MLWRPLVPLTKHCIAALGNQGHEAMKDVPWKVCLGDRDYIKSPTAQVLRNALSRCPPPSLYPSSVCVCVCSTSISPTASAISPKCVEALWLLAPCWRSGWSVVSVGGFTIISLFPFGRQVEYTFSEHNADGLWSCPTHGHFGFSADLPGGGLINFFSIDTNGCDPSVGARCVWYSIYWLTRQSGSGSASRLLRLGCCSTTVSAPSAP